MIDAARSLNDPLADTLYHAGLIERHVPGDGMPSRGTGEAGELNGSLWEAFRRAVEYVNRDERKADAA